MSALLCLVYAQLVQCLGRTAQIHSTTVSIIPSYTSSFTYPRAFPFLSFTTRIFSTGWQGRFRVLGGFVSMAAGLLCSQTAAQEETGGESRRKSLNVPISMQGHVCCGRQCLQRQAAVGVPLLHSAPGEDGVAGIRLQQAGAEGQMPLAGAERRLPHLPHACCLTDELSGIIRTLQAKCHRNREVPNFLLGINKGKSYIHILCI